ncbi:hypothetical protein ScPMuIL_012537 [Solemya velum]
MFHPSQSFLVRCCNRLLLRRKHLNTHNTVAFINGNVNNSRREYSSGVDGDGRPRTSMCAWHVHSYGGDEELSLSTTARLPIIHGPNDVLVEVHAASVNPVDVKMRGGYGRDLFKLMRRTTGDLPDFPLTLGRDFSGVVVSVGRSVKHFKTGDEIWGAIPAHKPGTHAEYVIASESEVSKKPASLLHEEAAALPYVICTTWQALCAVGILNPRNIEGQRVLILGGSGGVGTFAIQLMKAWGAEVTVTCGADAVNLVTSLGADIVIDYKSQSFKQDLKQIDGFDLVYDLFGHDKALAHSLLKTWRLSKYVTIETPLIKNVDSLGLPLGITISAGNFGFSLLKAMSKGQAYGWGLFRPSSKALETVAALIDSAQIIPVVEKVFQFSETPLAYDKVSQGHARGKTVISMQNESK